jgi:hypothetical protein
MDELVQAEHGVPGRGVDQVVRTEPVRLASALGAVEAGDHAREPREGARVDRLRELLHTAGEWDDVGARERLARERDLLGRGSVREQQEASGAKQPPTLHRLGARQLLPSLNMTTPLTKPGAL